MTEVININSKKIGNYEYGDKNVNVDLANRISREILNCKTRIIENEGHFSLTGNYLRDILTDLKK